MKGIPCFRVCFVYTAIYYLFLLLFEDEFRWKIFIVINYCKYIFFNLAPNTERLLMVGMKQRTAQAHDSNNHLSWDWQDNVCKLVELLFHYA